jgi:hypothetical protein
MVNEKLKNKKINEVSVLSQIKPGVKFVLLLIIIG